MRDGPSAIAVIVISSHVARGSVGNRASVFALESLSYPVWAVPTVILPWHPGHGPSTRIVPGKSDFSSFLGDIANSSWISEVGAVISGYMAEPWQIDEVANLVRKIKKTHPSITYLCDPVIGDESGLYVPSQTAIAIRDQLIPICDIATPNRYELAWLESSNPAKSISESIEQARRMACSSVLVTSAPGSNPGLTGNLLVTDDRVWATEHPELSNPPNGPGDLTAAIFLAHHLSGIGDKENLSRTTSTVLEIIEQSRALAVDELPLERCIPIIVNTARGLKVYEV